MWCMCVMTVCDMSLSHRFLLSPVWTHMKPTFSLSSVERRRRGFGFSPELSFLLYSVLFLLLISSPSDTNPLWIGYRKFKGRSCKNIFSPLFPALTFSKKNWFNLYFNSKSWFFSPAKHLQYLSNFTFIFKYICLFLSDLRHCRLLYCI